MDDPSDIRTVVDIKGGEARILRTLISFINHLQAPGEGFLGESLMAFTTREISNYLKYEKVRSGGHYNMFDKDAHKATELETDDYNFVMRNYYFLSSQAKRST